MAPEGRISPDYDPNPPGALDAAVLLLVSRSRELAFIRRATDGRAHSGQIAFPGGAREPGDQDLIMTALRETEEEIGVPATEVTVLGRLTPLYISVSNFVVHPVVGCIDHWPGFVCQESEVDEVYTLPISEFAAVRDERELKRGTTGSRAPCYRFPGVTVWGATAMITAEFLQIWTEAAAGPD